MITKEKSVWEVYDRHDGLPGYRRFYPCGAEAQALATCIEQLPDDTKYDGRALTWTAWFLKPGYRKLVMPNHRDGTPFAAAWLVRGYADDFVARHAANGVWPALLRDEPYPPGYLPDVFPTAMPWENRDGDHDPDAEAAGSPDY